MFRGCYKNTDRRERSWLWAKRTQLCFPYGPKCLAIVLGLDPTFHESYMYSFSFLFILRKKMYSHSRTKYWYFREETNRTDGKLSTCTSEPDHRSMQQTCISKLVEQHGVAMSEQDARSGAARITDGAKLKLRCITAHRSGRAVR